jgi:large subunit ribosomal protein L30
MAQLEVTLERSGIGHPADQKATLRALSLHRLHQTVVVEDTPSIRGMIRKVSHLVKVRPVEGPGE